MHSKEGSYLQTLPSRCSCFFSCSYCLLATDRPANPWSTNGARSRKHRLFTGPAPAHRPSAVRQPGIGQPGLSRSLALGNLVTCGRSIAPRLIPPVRWPPVSHGREPSSKRTHAMRRRDLICSRSRARSSVAPGMDSGAFQSIPVHFDAFPAHFSAFQRISARFALDSATPETGSWSSCCSHGCPRAAFGVTGTELPRAELRTGTEGAPLPLTPLTLATRHPLPTTHSPLAHHSPLTTPHSRPHRRRHRYPRRNTTQHPARASITCTNSSQPPHRTPHPVWRPPSTSWATAQSSAPVT